MAGTTETGVLGNYDYISRENLIIKCNEYAMTKEEIGGFVAKQRKLRGWTQTELAEKIEVSKRTVVNIEKGDFKNHTNVNKILALFGFKLGFGLVPIL